MPYQTFKFKMCKEPLSSVPTNHTTYTCRKRIDGLFEVVVNPDDEHAATFHVEEILNHLISGEWRIQRKQRVFQD